MMGVLTLPIWNAFGLPKGRKTRTVLPPDAVADAITASMTAHPPVEVTRDITEVDELLTRMRERARVQTYLSHRAALPRLREQIASTNLRLLGITDAVDESVGGYLAQTGLDDLVSTLGLRVDAGGSVVLRTTQFDFDRVRALVATPTVAALDAATSADPRLRGVGHRALGELLEAYR